ncbi:MAG: hypothetical protein P4L55_19120 [Syntrophobacteraceae bacterium]|nr:hypothetical protein [Syntrophobacteraceae bacterium]
MIKLVNHPMVVFGASFLCLSLSVWLGRAVAKSRYGLEEDTRKDFDTILAATLTLLGLIVGFSFSMALGRYDQRKNLEAEEANAIGTEYVRVQLLPAADAAKARSFLLVYLDKRILFYESRNRSELERITARTAQLQAGLWGAVRAPAVAQPQPVAALAVEGMNDVLNSEGYTLAAWQNRIPSAAWALMVAIALLSNLMIGYGSRAGKGRSFFLLIFPLVVSVAFLLIADIDCPNGGLIQVVPQNLLGLSQSLHAR